MSKNIIDTIINTQIAVVTSIACMLVYATCNHVHISSIPLDGKCCTPGQFLIEDKLNVYTTKRMYITRAHCEHGQLRMLLILIRREHVLSASGRSEP